MRPALCLLATCLLAAAPEPPADTSPLIVEGVLNAPPAEVWKVFSTAEGFKALGVEQCEMDFRIGGRIRSSYQPILAEASSIQHRILAFEPERMLAFRIEKAPAGFPFPNAWQSVWSVVSLAPLAEGRTTFRLAQMGYGADPESQRMRDFFRTGNTWTLRKLQQRYDPALAVAPASRAHDQ